MGPLLVEKKHQIGWVLEKAPVSARGRLELIWAPHWSTLYKDNALITNSTLRPKTENTYSIFFFK